MRPVCSSAMAVSTVAGALLAGETRQMGRTAPKFSSRPRRLFDCSRLNEHDHNKCVLQVPRASFFDSRPGRSSSHLDSAKNAGDGFFPDVSDDTDEMYDELFKKYGKVVFKSTDQKPPSKEAEEDAESLSFAVEMAKVASDVKAAELKVLFVKPVVYWTRFFIIATAFSFPQINAIGSRMRDLAEQKYGRVATGDVKANSWYLLDFGDVVVHVFLPEQRAFYNLDEFYGNAASIELPFENQPPPSR